MTVTHSIKVVKIVAVKAVVIAVIAIKFAFINHVIYVI